MDGGGGGVHMRKERKVTSVMGWALRRQLSVPGVGFSMIVVAVDLVRSLMGGHRSIFMALQACSRGIGTWIVSRMAQGDEVQ